VKADAEDKVADLVKVVAEEKADVVAKVDAVTMALLPTPATSSTES
jgi:hypothetical protein